MVLQSVDPACCFLPVCTDHLNPSVHGVSYHGHAVSGGRKSSGGPLALKRELRELGSQVESREREADTLTETLEELEKSSANPNPTALWTFS